MRHERKSATFAALAAATVSACAAIGGPFGRDAGPESIVIARVDGEPLTFENAMDAFLPSHTGHGILVRGEQAIRELAGRIVERRLFLQEAMTLGVHEDPEVLLAVEEYGLALAGIEFWKREVDEQIFVSDEEVEAFYAKTDQALSLSLLQVDDGDRAEELREAILGGAEFAELAEAESTHASASFGGAVTYVRRGELERSLEDLAFALEEPGDLTPVVETEDGFVFVRLDERTLNPVRPDRDVAIPQIRSILESRVEDRLREETEARVQREAAASLFGEWLVRDELIGEGNGDVIVAESSGETLTMDAFRTMLNMDAIRSGPEQQVAEAALAIAAQWTQRRAVALAVKGTDILEDPDVVRKLEKFRRDAILTTLYEDYVYGDLEYGEEDIRAYYDEHSEDEFTRPPEVRLAYLVVAEAQTAEEAARRLAAGEDFETVANDVSIDQASAAHGGRIGWVRPGQILSVVEERVFALEIGELDGPIETELGYFVVQALDRRDSVPVPYEMARRMAEERVAKSMRKNAYDEWARALRERAGIEILDEGIREAAAWVETQAADDGGDVQSVIDSAPAPSHGGGAP